MKLPNGADAIVDISKLRDYCLNPAHLRGRHKARVFLSALGLAIEDATELQVALQRAAREQDAVEGVSDLYGTRYIIDFEMTRGNRTATIRSSWIVSTNDEAARLLTCYVL
jgi:hypothetical protein